MKSLLVIFYASLMAFLGATYIFFAAGGTNLALFVLQVATMVNFLYWLQRLVKRMATKIVARLKKTRFGRFFLFISEAIAKITGAVKNKVGGVLARLIPSGGPILRRYSDERVSIYAERSNLTVRLRKMRWRSLEDNRQRIRFCYIAYIKKQLKQGARISTADTPNEVFHKLAEADKEPNDTLFALYNQARYNENSNITTQEVESVR